MRTWMHVSLNLLRVRMVLHLKIGLDVGWILLGDSLAGAMVFLSITGMLLWTKMRGLRLVMVGLVGTSTVLAMAFALVSVKGCL